MMNPHAAARPPGDSQRGPEIDHKDGAVARVVPGLAGVIAAVFLAKSLALGTGSLQDPGPGLWPAAVSGFTLLSAVVLAVRGTPWLLMPDSDARWSLWSILAMGASSWALNIVGFVFATIPLAFFLTRVVGNASVIASIATALLVPPVTYFLFNTLLGVPLL
jgi:putative tricarboxylic transport membrane protein